jgi:hypothetical protein
MRPEKKYCTYVTCYSGNLLPPFYIGYSTIDKVNNGYRGSVSSKRYKAMWKKEIKERPDLFKTKIITIHDTSEEAKAREEDLQRKLNVIKNEMYANKAIGHHYDNTGNKCSEETKKVLRTKRKALMESGWIHPNKGKKNPGVGGRKSGGIPWNKGMIGVFTQSKESNKKRSETLKKTIAENGHHSTGKKQKPEWIQKRIDNRKPFSEEQKRAASERAKKINLLYSKKGTKWYNDGVKSVMLYSNEKVPDGMIPGRIKWKNREIQS